MDNAEFSNMHVFEWWEEAATTAENLSRNQENMQIPHSPGPGMEPTVQNTVDEHRLSHLTSPLLCQQNGISVPVG